MVSQGYRESRGPCAESGVNAVRAGEALAANLRRARAGELSVPGKPQSRALYLISTGERHAMAVWGQVCVQGKWLWKLKDWIEPAPVMSCHLSDHGWAGAIWLGRDRSELLRPHARASSPTGVLRRYHRWMGKHITIHDPKTTRAA